MDTEVKNYFISKFQLNPNDLEGLPEELANGCELYLKYGPEDGDNWDEDDQKNKVFWISQRSGYIDEWDGDFERFSYDLVLQKSIAHKEGSSFSDIDWKNPLHELIPCFYTYPFFLNPSRRRRFCVVPVGKQKLIFLIVDKTNGTYASNHTDTIGNSSVYTFKVLKELLSVCYNNSQFFCTAQGYIFTSIIADFSLKNGIGYMFFPITKELAEEEIKSIFFSREGADQFDIKHYQPSNLDVLALDPVHFNRMTEIEGYKLKSKYDVISIEHNIDVSVGLGFSYPLLPAIIRNKNWKKIQGLITPKEKELRDKLHLLGIDLNTFERTTER